jgi:hypothetical protein
MAGMAPQPGWRILSTDGKEPTMMRFVIISRLIRQLSGRGALDNVTQVIEARDAMTAQLDELVARVTVPVAVEVPAAA